MAAESNAIDVECNTETVQRSTSSLQQDNGLCSELSLMNAPPPALQASGSPNKSRKRRKRSWTSDQSVLQQPFPTRKINFSGNEVTCASVGWPQNFTAPSYVVGKPLKGLGVKETVTFAKNYNQHQRKRAPRSNFGPVGSSVDSFLPGDMWPSIAGNDGKCETEDTEKFDDFSKEFHKAIDRIESLIPSLQKLVNCVQTPTGQKSVGNVELRNTYSSICDDGLVNRLGRAKFWEVTGNDVANTSKYAEHCENILSEEVNQMPRVGKYPISFAVKQNSTLCAKGDAKYSRKEFIGPDETVNQAMTVIPTNFSSGKHNDRVRLEVGLEQSFHPQKSWVRGQTAFFPMNRVELLRRTSSGNESVISHTPEHFQGLRMMPCQCSKNIYNQKQTSKQASGKDLRLRFRTPVPSVGSSSVRRPNRISSVDKYDHEASKSHARERMTHFRDSVRRNSIRRKSMDGASQSKIMRKNQISEDTSCSSPFSFSGTSTDSYSNGSDETDTYSSSRSDETGGYHRVGQSSRKWSSSSESTSDYKTSSHDISQDQYSDIGASNQSSSERSNKWEDHLEKSKKVGRMSTLRKKLGMIFHHHHHHHYSDRDESDLGHVGLLKRLGKMFHQKGKIDSQRLKVEKSRKPVTKSVVQKKQDGGHFRTLIDGLMHHMGHSKKTKKAKDDIERLGSARHRGKKGKKKLSWWPKMGRDKVKVTDRGKVKLERVVTRARRPQFAAAKMILR